MSTPTAGEGAAVHPAFPDIPGQRGFATRRQLARCGWSPSATRHLIATVGRELFPNVVVPHRGRLTDEDVLAAEALWAGVPAVLTGGRALRVHGVLLPAPPVVDRFLVPGPARCREVHSARIVRTKRMPHRLLIDGVWMAPAVRALADAGRYGEYGKTQMQALTIRVLQGHVVTVAELSDELRAGRRNGTAALRRGLLDYCRGAWSLPEVWLARVVAGRALPPMVQNATLFAPDGRRIGTPDGYFPGSGIAVQVHSRQHHDGVDAAGRDNWERTVEADSAFAAHGVLTLGVAPTTLRDQPDQFLDRLESAIQVQEGRPLPQVIIRQEPTRRLAA